METLSCKCGALYEIIKTEGPTRTDGSFNCLVCKSELFTWAGSNVSQFRLISTPTPDRE